jgi:hypothetical protein
MKPFDWEFPYPSQRMPILARNVVAPSQPLAAQAGLRMLMKGGSAVDAVLATAIALTVLEPTSNGIGSDAFGPRARGVDAGALQGHAGNADARLGFGDGTRMRRGVGRTDPCVRRRRNHAAQHACRYLAAVVLDKIIRRNRPRSHTPSPSMQCSSRVLAR